jgi:selenocysteine lyase/cysteine desulfurase
MPGWMGATNPFNISFKELDLAPGAKRFTQSTMSYLSLKGLEVSIQEILDLGLEKIENHSKKLKNYFISFLSDIGYQTFHDEKIYSAPHIVSIFGPEKKMYTISKSLSEKGVFCSLRNGYLRVSLAHYNDQKDIDKLLSILEDWGSNKLSS